MRSELPAEAEPPVVEVQRADRPYATFYLSFTSTRARRAGSSPTGCRARCSRSSRRSPGVQRVSFEGGQPLAMRVWIDPDRLAALNLSPGDVQAALQRNNYLAAVGQTKGNLVQVNLLANTDLRAADEFENLIVAERDGAIVRLRDVARVELGAEEAAMVAKYNDQQARVPRCLAAARLERDRSRAAAARRDGAHPPDAAAATSTCGWCGTARCSWATRSKEITKTLAETMLIVALVVFLFMGSVRTALVPLVAMPVSLVGAAHRDAGASASA